MEAQSSSSSTSYRRSQSLNLSGGSRLCDCGIPEVMKTSWTNANPGRRFYSCRNYNSPNERISKRGCNHFRWFDVEPMSDRAKEVINTLKMEKRQLLKENKQLNEKCSEDGRSEEIELLSANISELQMKANVEVKMMKNRLKILYFALVVSWFLLIYVSLK
ncbi:hypothetical protein C2S52_021958 [Perilla frutescens var. hirtella]|nr:hypothetical protein C2S52_005622 [Perilla frutescens var. hirtella]KAH6797404.1 hypothetical protein C2S52_021958 [Perilla frutescens var. hirtella]